MLITLMELIDAVVMTLAVGFIFMNLLNRFTQNYYIKRFDWKVFWFACLITAPAILLHELSHKFVSISFGMTATFHAAYMWLGIGVLLVLMRSPFLFFVPAFVAISGTGTDLGYSISALAGPAMNFVLWMIALTVLKTQNIKKKHMAFWYLTKQINMFLFIFNMLPIPGFDGFHFFSGMFRFLF